MFQLAYYLYHTLAIGSITYLFCLCRRKKQDIELSNLSYEEDLLEYHKTLVSKLESLRNNKKVE